MFNAELESKMAYATRPVVEIPAAPSPKRKRSSSTEDVSDLEESYEVKRRKSQPLVEQSSEEQRSPEAEASIDGRVGIESKPLMSPSKIRETLDSQFSLEILLKHQELRLINQELAKCQVALEQLRRCHLIPYPTTQATPESMFNISEGTGCAVWQSGEVPQWAPAFGVADGPYTRHYAKWLIPDPRFDGIQVGGQRGSFGSRAGQSGLEGRSTRHSYAEGMPPANKSRSQRTSGKHLQALSSGYPAPKEKPGPLVVKRADGQMVKLECVDCHRFDFSSVQGFINHCRIAHKREFKSHEEAANTSGQPIEIDETSSGAVVEEKTPPTANGLVHPLIYASSPDKSAYSALLSRISDSVILFQQGAHPVTSIPTSSTSTPIKSSGCKQTPHPSLVPSADTPHLSTWMKSKGLGGDLIQSVGDAKKLSDLDDLSSPEDEDSEDDVKPVMTPSRRLGGLDSADSPPTMRVPARATMSPAPFKRPGSSKGLDIKNARIPGISPRLAHATPVINTAAASQHNRPSARVINDFSIDPLDQSQSPDVDIEMMDGPSSIDLSPHTITSNNAPSLVSDDGEYDEGDDAESASSEEEDDDSVAEIDIEDEQVVPRTVLRNRAGSGGDSGVRLRKEDKHVTFVSPVKESGTERRRK